MPQNDPLTLQKTHNLRRDHFAALALPLAPLNEQKRIADKLDAVLARVDACRERLDRVPTILKRFRQSVLAAATSGKLTEEWRDAGDRDLRSWREAVTRKAIPLPKGYRRLTKQSSKPTPIDHAAGLLPPTWDIATIGDLYKLNVIIDFADGNHGSLYPRKEEFGDEGALFLTATQIGQQWELDARACPRLRSDKADKLTKGWAHAGDVLLTHNATVGRVALLNDVGEDVLLGTSVTFYRFNMAFIEPRFARVIFSSQFFQDQLESVMKQTTRDQVPITKQVSLNVICPPIEEQHEIVRRVESLFAYANHLEARYAAGRARVERLTSVLLAKAFRGELVPQDPSDEPACVRLDRIRAARATTPANAKERMGGSRANKAQKTEVDCCRDA